MRDGHVAHVCCGAFHVVHKAGELINADVRLHTEVPLVALLDLMHFSVACFVSVLGWAWRRENRRVDNRAGTQAQARARQVRVDGPKHLVGQAVRPHQPTEVKDGRLIGDGVQPAKPGKQTH